MKELIKDTVKNLLGWRTKRKIVVISVDDYGNVRLDSKKARENMDRAGMKTYSIFDAVDALEDKEDLEMLFDALSSVKDKNGNHAVFTPFALPCNINFEKMEETGYTEYYYERLPETYAKLKGYEGTWDLWQEGIRKGLMVPQFHGREHLNLKLFEERLQKKDHELLTALKNRSYASISDADYPTISFTAAFEFWDFKENERFNEVISTGLEAFEKVYGYPSIHFNSHGGREHPIIHQSLKNAGVRYIDTPFIKHEHQGHGKYKRILNYTGKKNALGQTYLVRNVVFEPSEEGIDWVALAMRQIEAAFSLNKAAIISSHRVNFGGHIDPANRKLGVDTLKTLLKAIAKKWPDVEFMSASQLGDLISGQNNNA